MKNGYLNVSAVLKFAATQNESKRAEMKLYEPRTSISDSRPNFPYHVNN